MNNVHDFYDKLATKYDKLFLDWKSAIKEQASILNKIFTDNNFNNSTPILDCACGIGTQAIGLALLGYNVTASDISDGALAEARKRALELGVKINFKNADFCNLSSTFSEKFKIIIAMDNALPHMLTKENLNIAVKSITNQLDTNGIFVGSIRDYDELLKEKPTFTPPYIHKTQKGKNVSFQTWDWDNENYKLIQYVIEDSDNLIVSKFECEYRATKREELTNLFINNGCKNVVWLFPKESNFYQPIFVAKK